MQTASQAAAVNGLYVFPALWHILRCEGISALYHGFATALLFAVPATIVYLCTYEATRAYLSFLGSADTNSFIHLLAGALAEFLSNVFWCPMEVIKSRQQAKNHMFPAGKYIKLNAHPSRPHSLSDGEMDPDLDLGDDALPLHNVNRAADINQSDIASANPNLSTIGFIKSIYLRQGIFGFFVGFWLGLLVYMPYSIIYFVLYERFKNIAAGEAGRESLSAPAYIICSATAGAIAAAATNCLDVPKTAFQVARDAASRSGEGFFDVVIEIWQREGISGFNRGCAARVFWMVPTIVLQFTVYENVKSWLK